MSVAPLHGKPTPVLLIRRSREDRPRPRIGDLKAAPLSSRARRIRGRRVGTVALAAGTLLLVLVAVMWTVYRWH